MLTLTPGVHHDGSPLYASSLSPRLGEKLTLRLCTRREHRPETVVLRTVRDGEPHVVTADLVDDGGPDVWWQAEIVVRNVETHYRWLLVGGAFDFAWLTAGGLVDYDVPDATDFVISATPAPPEWVLSSVIYQVFPDRFARAAERGTGTATAPEGVDAALLGRALGRGPTSPRAGASTPRVSTSVGIWTGSASTSTTWRTSARMCCI